MNDTLRATVLVAALVMVAQLFSGREVAAQTSGGCPSGFSLSSAGIASSADANLDGFVCRSEPDVRSNGIVETMVVDNTVPPCSCPDAFVSFTAIPPGSGADRNGDGWVCSKVVIVGPPGGASVKVVTIDNAKCNH
jgi:hypothetical protein